MEQTAKTEKEPRGSGTAAKTAVCALALAAVLLTVHAVLCLYHGMYPRYRQQVLAAQGQLFAACG